MGGVESPADAENDLQHRCGGGDSHRHEARPMAGAPRIAEPQFPPPPVKRRQAQTRVDTKLAHALAVRWLPLNSFTPELLTSPARCPPRSRHAHTLRTHGKGFSITGHARRVFTVRLRLRSYLGYYSRERFHLLLANQAPEAVYR